MESDHSLPALSTLVARRHARHGYKKTPAAIIAAGAFITELPGPVTPELTGR